MAGVKWYEVTEDDLRWWLETAGKIRWQEAKTYRDAAPHSYIVAGRTPGIGWPETRRVAALIRRYGVPQKYYGNTNLYLLDEERGVKWWAMDFWPEDTNLINMAPIDQYFGVQDAPVTRTDRNTFYDRIGMDFDRRHPQGLPKEREAVRAMVRQVFYDQSPRTLDVGAGIGTTLDMGICSPKSCTAVDPSQHLLNINVMRNKTLDRTLAGTLAECEGNLLGRYDLTLATFGTGSLLTPEEVGIQLEHTRKMALVMLWPDGWIPDVYEGHSDEREKASDFAWQNKRETRSVLAEAGAERIDLGRYETWVMVR